MGKVNIVEKDGKKYIDGEEVLCEYDCWTNWILIRFFLFLSLLIGLTNHYFFKLHQYDFESFFSVGFLLLLLIGWGWMDLKTMINRGIYITQNYIISFSGKKIPLEDVYYRWGGGGVEWGSVALRLYKKNRLFISCLANETKDYKNMILVLEKVSNNKHLKEHNLRDAKRKLIQTKEESNGK